MKLADEMSRLTREYEDQYFDPYIFKHIISLIENAARQGKYTLRLYVSGKPENYRSLIRHLYNEGFAALYVNGSINVSEKPSQNYIDILWRGKAL